MLRLRVLASAVPLLLLGLLARGELSLGPRPCIAVGDQAVQIASALWQARLHVGFTDDSSRATVRVQIVDRPEAADFVVADDAGDDEPSACALASQTKWVAIAAHPKAADPIIYLSHEAGADYRIFVSSNSFSTREAAALLVGASERFTPITTASIASRS